MIYPQACRAGFIVRELARGLLVRDPRRKRQHRLNDVAAWVWARCDGRTPVTLLAEHMRWMFGLSDPLPVLQATLEKLSRWRLLEDVSPEWSGGRLRRRDLLTRLIASLIAVPFALLSVIRS